MASFFEDTFEVKNIDPEGKIFDKGTPSTPPAFLRIMIFVFFCHDRLGSIKECINRCFFGVIF